MKTSPSLHPDSLPSWDSSRLWVLNVLQGSQVKGLLPSAAVFRGGALWRLGLKNSDLTYGSMHCCLQLMGYGGRVIGPLKEGKVALSDSVLQTGFFTHHSRSSCWGEQLHAMPCSPPSCSASLYPEHWKHVRVETRVPNKPVSFGFSSRLGSWKLTSRDNKHFLQSP